MKSTTLFAAVLAALLLASCDRTSVEAEAPMSPAEPSRGVNLPASCNAQASGLMQQAVSELHNMMYVTARNLFEQAATSDPNCVMADWGVAMTHIHPLWPDRPTASTLAAMQTRIALAIEDGAPTARESAYLGTVQAYYEDAPERSERERLMSFALAWRDLLEAFPTDVEAKAFFALSYLATAEPDDKSYVIQNEAGALAEAVLAEAPDHPGGHHYAIHAYDYPGLAERALPVAMHYGKIAPETAHALHMMSHIFTRLGMWEESIRFNRRSADAAWKLSQAQGGQNSHYHHALDYLGYAYLQTAQDDKALEAVNNARRTDLPYGEMNPGALAHALTALPVRYALERRDWAAAAKLSPGEPATFDWTAAPPAYVALLHYGRALGLAHENKFADAEAEITQLEEIGGSLAEAGNAFWAGHVNIKATAARGWLEFQRGDQDAGLALLRRAGEMEAATDKHAVTPGYVLPARELLGELLLEVGETQAALAAFEATLAESPRRLNSLYGKARALSQLGDNTAAEAVLDQIRALTMHAHATARPWLAEVRTTTAAT